MGESDGPETSVQMAEIVEGVWNMARTGAIQHEAVIGQIEADSSPPSKPS